MSSKPDGTIGVRTAVAMYKTITGTKISERVLIQEVFARRHLGVWGMGEGASAIFLGLNERRFKYFVQSRLALYGRHRVFCSPELDV